MIEDNEKFREEQLRSIPDIKAKALHYVFENNMISDDGLWLEFGVYQAASLNRMAKYTDKPIIFGFDSFEGLPEAWEGRLDGVWGAGAFGLQGVMPKVPAHVTLIKGWYKDTIPEFNKKNSDPIALLHIDSDIYSSASQILHGLVSRIANNSIVVFDELVGYPGYEHHEWKAWWEFVNAYGVTFEWIGSNPSRSVPINEMRVSKGTQLFDADRTDNHPKNNISPAWENVALKIVNNPYFGRPK